MKLGTGFKGAGEVQAYTWGMNHISLFPLGKKGLKESIYFFKDRCDLSCHASSFTPHLPAPPSPILG